MATDSQRNTFHSFWDSFEHLLLFISLFILMVALQSTLHLYVEYWLPSPLEDAKLNSSLFELNLVLLRFYIAGLIISYPIFAFLFLKITRRTMEFPVVRELKSRKLLTYLTLFLTFILLVFNAFSIVYNFLDGNVSLNFILHFLITGAVNGLVFIYYLHQIREDRKVYV
jgi:hypothetical protein